VADVSWRARKLTAPICRFSRGSDHEKFLPFWYKLLRAWLGIFCQRPLKTIAAPPLLVGVAMRRVPLRQAKPTRVVKRHPEGDW
jgi:hypothetical protein